MPDNVGAPFTREIERRLVQWLRERPGAVTATAMLRQAIADLLAAGCGA